MWKTIETWLPLRGRWLRYFLAALALLGLPVLCGGFFWLFNYARWPVSSVRQVEAASEVRFPAQARLVRAEVKGYFWELTAVLTMPASTVEEFLSQPRFGQVERAADQIRASGSRGINFATVNLVWSRED